MARDLYFYDREFDVDIYVCPMVDFLRGFDPSINNEEFVKGYQELDKYHEEYRFCKNLMITGRFGDYEDKKELVSKSLRRFMISVFRRPNDYVDLGYAPGELLQKSKLDLSELDQEECILATRGERPYDPLEYWMDELGLFEDEKDKDGIRQLREGVGVAYRFNRGSKLWTPKKLVAA